MIRDLTETLEALLSQPGLPPELGNAQISFDRPSDTFDPGQPTINLFLFDIRESADLRSNEPVRRRVGDLTLIERPPARVACTYLVTAWPVNGNDLAKQEHRMLSQALRLFMGTPVIPDAFLVGSLIGQEPPLPVLLVQPDGVRNPAEFWAAIGNRIRPSILVSVTFSMRTADDEEFPTVFTNKVTIRPNLNPAAGETFHRVGGVVTDAAADPVASAEVRLVEPNRSTATNWKGEFTIPVIAPGTYTLRVTSGGVTQNKPITVPAPLGANYDVQLP